MRTERRRYFRIDDTSLVRYRVLDATHIESARAAIGEHLEESDNLRAAFEPLDARLTDLAPALRRESRVLAEALELINRKLTLLAGISALERGAGTREPHREHALLAVNLSGGGMALEAHEALAAGIWLAIDLVLLPGNHALRALGRVTDSRKRQGSFAIGIEFDTLSEQERDILIGHALRKQAQMLKQERATPPRPR